MSAADPRASLRAAASWLLWATIVIVVDFRVEGIDVVNDVIGAALVVPGIQHLRDAARAIGADRPFGPLTWVAALIHVPLVIAEEFTALGTTEAGVVGLMSALVSIGGTVLAALTFERCLRSSHPAEDDLAARWRRTAWWVGVFGGVPATLTILAPLIGLAEETDRGDLIGLLGGAALLAIAGLAFGLMALISLLTSLSRTRKLDQPTVPPAA